MQDFVYNPPIEPFLDILFEDTEIMVVNKPSGLLSVPGRLPEHQDSIIKRIWQKYPLAMASHRLDMDTSGIMVVGLNKEAISSLGKLFEKKEVTKRYLAVVNGKIDEHGQIDLPIRCDLDNRPLQIVDHLQGKKSLTIYDKCSEYEVAKNIDGTNTSIVKLTPVTGRSHQLRLHLASIGHPILGDSFYSDETIQAKAPRLCLHAYLLEFKHPKTQELLHFEVLPNFLKLL